MLQHEPDLAEDPLLSRNIPSRLARRFIARVYGSLSLLQSSPPAELLVKQTMPFTGRPSYVFRYCAWLRRKLRRSGLHYLIPYGIDVIPALSEDFDMLDRTLEHTLAAPSIEYVADYYLRHLDYLVDPQRHSGLWAQMELLASIAGLPLAAGLTLAICLMYFAPEQGLFGPLFFFLLALGFAALRSYLVLAWRQDRRRMIFLEYLVGVFGELTEDDLGPEGDPRLDELVSLVKPPISPWLGF